ncbi:MAG TPA: alpha/beta hydrolase [Solirubrobacterales bacterium]|jgi:acetyl esterase|nr:alpha/beta hydrolase [Solirubrobacterales bacterium]
MELDAQIKQLADNLPGGLTLPFGDPVTAREEFLRISVAGATLVEPFELGEIRDLEIDGADGRLPARLYKPATDEASPLLLFLHGGGFVLGDLESYDMMCRILCHRSGVEVLSVEYRVAPDHPWPAAADDAVAAARWTFEHADEIGADRARIAIGGDSAGGNLAAVAAQALRGSEHSLAGQLLIYPVVDFNNSYPSIEENADAPLLNREVMVWFNGLYIGVDDDRSDPRISPLLADDLSGLPPTLVVTAGFDPLRDQGDAYAEALKNAGVEVVHQRFPSLIHGFFGLGPLSKGADDAIREVCDALRDLLA